MLRAAICAVSAMGLMISANADDSILQKRADELIQNSQAAHFPENQTSLPEVSLRIQEPRLTNPDRFSEVSFGENGIGFQLTRNRGSSLTTYIIHSDGTPELHLDGAIISNEEIQRAYRLTPDRAKLYQKIYRFMYSLPLSLTPETISEIIDIDEHAMFQDKTAIAMTLKLTEPIFSSDWIVYFSTEENQLLGLDLVEENKDEGERIIFSGDILIDGAKIPRMRHWYKIPSNDYLGSDIIITAKTGKDSLK